MTQVTHTNLEIDDWFAQPFPDFNMFIMDPPYPFDSQNGTNRFQDMYQVFSWERMQDIFSKMYQKTLPGGRVYVFANRDGLFQTIKSLEAVGFDFLNFIVWDKLKLGGGYHWRNQVEYIVYVSKGRPACYIKNAPNVFSYKKPTLKDAVPSINYIPDGTSPKPYQIWEKILLHGSMQDDIIADPFAGSNPLRAAVLLNPILQSRIKEAYTNTYLTNQSI